MIQLVSIIIPNYNHAPFLEQRLESIYNQSYQCFEVILLDDASTDDSLSILNTYKEHPKTNSLIVNELNSGSPFKQWQKGIDLAKGEFIWIAESDDYCELSFLEKMLNFLNENSNVGLGYCQTTDVDENGNEILNRIDYTKQFQPNIWETNFTLEGFKFVTSYLEIKNVIPNASAVLFKRELVSKESFSNSLVTMKMCGDWFFWIQLSLKTDIGFFAKDLNYFRNHSSVSRNHRTLEIKKNRLLEEGVIRSYFQIEKLSTLKTEKEYYLKWFKLHQFSSIFNSFFYKGKLVKTAIFTFVTKFIRFKFRKY